MAIPLGVDSFGLNLESGFDTLLFELNPLTGFPEGVENQVIVMERRMEFNISTLSQDLEVVNRVLLRVNIYNGFPNDLLAQAYFMDGTMIVDSMFSEGSMPVPAGSVIGSGEIIQPAHRRQDAIFDPQRLENLEGATHLLLQAILQNPKVDTSLIPYYPDYLSLVDMGAMLDVTILLPDEEE